MADHVNFYENLKEAEMRLNHTIVMYDNEPYYVLCISDHKNDGIFRIYLEKLGADEMEHYCKPVPYEGYPGMTGTKGDAMDEYLSKSPDSRIMRKMMNSPHFNKFRPFPLGMMNYNGSTMFTERVPSRHTQQGLTSSMVLSYNINLDPAKTKQPMNLDSMFLSKPFYKTIMGDYPTAQESLSNMLTPEVGGGNRAVGFHRLFAFVRGPMDLIFLAYKYDIVGFVPNGDLSRVDIASQYGYVKEVVESLGIFQDIRIKS